MKSVIENSKRLVVKVGSSLVTNSGADNPDAREAARELSLHHKREGRWQIMVHGESYKPIVAEATKTAIGEQNVYERIFAARLLPGVFLFW